MGLSVDDIVKKFPTKTIPNIQGESNYASISNTVQPMYSNAASLPTTLGGRRHGHVGLIITPILYAILSNEPWICSTQMTLDQQHPSILTMQPRLKEKRKGLNTKKNDASMRMIKTWMMHSRHR
jgi:hypothetical protein